MPHSNNSYRWVQSSKATSPPGDGPLPSGPLQQKRNPSAEKRQLMNRRPRTRQMKNQCRSRLSSHSSLSSHISAPPFISCPAQPSPTGPCSATLLASPNAPRSTSSLTATSTESFRSRTQLNQVPGIGAKTFEQAAGFLRIRDGENPLDRTAVYPESYPVVEQIARSLNTPSPNSSRALSS